jgi:uncharacterized protein YjiS (DUF1127 family)
MIPPHSVSQGIANPWFHDNWSTVMNTHCTVNESFSTTDRRDAAAGRLSISRLPAGSRSADQLSVGRRLWSAVRAGVLRLQERHRIRRQQYIDRDAFLQMLKLDDELLDDIGVNREAVLWAARLPLSEDAARALRESLHGVGH